MGVNAQGTHVESVLPYRLVGGKMIWESIHVEDQTELTESEENPFGLKILFLLPYR